MQGKEKDNWAKKTNYFEKKITKSLYGNGLV